LSRWAENGGKRYQDVTAQLALTAAIPGLRNCGHSSGRLAEKLGQKNKSKRHFQIFLPQFFCQLKAWGRQARSNRELLR
jgi:hypothetical protein